MDEKQIGSRRSRTGFERRVSVGGMLDVSLEFTPALLTGRLRGQLRVPAARLLRATFRDALIQHPERLVIDTAGLVSCDAEGVAGLVASLDRIRPHVVPTAVAGLAPAHRAVLREQARRRGLEIRVYASLDEAVEKMMALPAAPRADSDTLLADVRNLHQALRTREAIEQAKGILMAIYGLDSDAAFSLLVWHSRRTRLPLRDLAARLVAAVVARQAGSLTIQSADALLADLAARPRNS